MSANTSENTSANTSEITDNTKQKRNAIIGVIIFAIVIALVSVIATFSNAEFVLDDSYFVSDDYKYVLNMDTPEDDLDLENAPTKTHIVYHYKGDKVTAMEAYYEFADEATAEKAFPQYQESFKDTEKYASTERNKKYIIVAAPESECEELNASEIAKYIELYESSQDTDDSTDETNETDQGTDTNQDTDE